MNINQYILLSACWLVCASYAVGQCTDNGNYWNESWVSCETSPNPNAMRGDSHWILYEFEENQYIDSSYVWNANRTGESGWGANEVVVDYSIDGTSWLELGTYTFPQAPENDGYMGFLGPDFGGIALNKILVTILSTHDPSATCASIAEMQFKVNLSGAQTNGGVVVQLHAYLEGYYNAGMAAMESQLGMIAPFMQPFNTSPWNYTGTETFSDANFPADFIDWVLVEARAASDANILVEQKAALLLADGSIISANQQHNGVMFNNLSINESYYFVIKGRGHLAVLSALPVQVPNASPYSFSASYNVAGGTTQLAYVGNDNYGLFAGDWDNDGVITVIDFNGFTTEAAIINQYVSGDFNGDGNVTVTDFNLYRPNASQIGVTPIRY
jgi:hypothetical protein